MLNRLNAPLQFRLLNLPHLSWQGHPPAKAIPLKGQALFIYLAMTAGQSHSRSMLAALLWGDMTEQAARTNLRVTLNKLRPYWAEYLHSSRHSLGFNEAASYSLDVFEFERAVHTQDFRTAVSLYHVDFLSDLYLPYSDTAMFEDWVTMERAHLRQQMVEALSALVRQASIQKDWLQGIQDAQRLLELEPWREDTHRDLMRFLVASGQRAAALVQYELCHDILAEELDVQPSPETQALYQSLKQAKVPPSSSSQNQIEIPHNLPRPASSFIGRTQALQQTHTLLTRPDCRLISMTGLGGMGKTRLALEVAWQLLEPTTESASNSEIKSFVDGIFFVPLLGLSQAEALVSAITTALSLTFNGPGDMQSQLINYLRHKRLLLILDNFEQLLSGIEVVVDLLEQASAIKMLVTSRVALNVVEEWVFPLTGLVWGEAKTGDEGQTSEAGLESEASQLFIERAKRVHLGFDVQAEAEAIQQVCHLLGGLPLGIELAAAWVRVISCAEIMGEIKTNLDFLSTRSELVPSHQHNLQAVFNHTWQLLPPAEQAVFARLCLFPSHFNRRAAQQIAQANLSQLSILIDKSFLGRTQRGWYEIHPLLKQYGAEKLASADLASTEQIFSLYYARFLQQRLPWRYQEAEQEALAEIALDLENIRAGWQILHKQAKAGVNDVATLYSQYTPMLGHFYETRGRYAEALAFFDEGLLTLQNLDWPKQKQRMQALVLAQIMNRLAASQFRLGHFEEALANLARSSQTLLVSLEVATDLEQAELAFAWTKRGQIEVLAGQYEVGEAALKQGLALYQSLREPGLSTEALNGLAASASYQGDYERAIELDQACLEIFQAASYKQGLGAALNNLGSSYGRRGDYEQAKHYYRQALNIAQQGPYPYNLLVALSNNGSNACDLQDYATALDYYQASLKLARQVGQRRWVAANLDGLGLTCLEQGQLEAAKHHLQTGLQEALDIHSTPDVLNSLALLGRLLFLQEPPESAARVLYFVLAHPACTDTAQKRAIAVLENIALVLAPSLLQAAKKWGQTQSLSAVVAGLNLPITL